MTETQIETLREGLARAVARQCPAWLAARREDIAQNALIRVVEAWRRAERSGVPEHSYLVKAAFTAVAQEIRALRKERAVELDGLPDSRAPASGAPGPDRAAEAGELGQAIRDCLAGLIDSRRAATALALYGYDRERIAALLGVPLRKVDNDRHRGMNDLRACLEGRGFSP